jgi:hypothetical protein
MQDHDELIAALKERSACRIIASHVQYREPVMKTVAIPAFIARGLASARASRKSGKYVSATAVLAKLSRHLAKARKRGIACA